MYEVIFTKQAKKDIDKLTSKNKEKLKNIILNIIKINPFEGKRLIGELKGYYSLRLNIKDRIVYKIDEKNKIVYIMMCKTHYSE
jgi:Txe/YoeB family toxin of toxin-antitoxin system